MSQGDHWRWALAAIGRYAWVILAGGALYGGATWLGAPEFFALLMFLLLAFLEFRFFAESLAAAGRPATPISSARAAGFFVRWFAILVLYAAPAILLFTSLAAFETLEHEAKNFLVAAVIAVAWLIVYASVGMSLPRYVFGGRTPLSVIALAREGFGARARALGPAALISAAMSVPHDFAFDYFDAAANPFGEAAWMTVGLFGSSLIFAYAASVMSHDMLRRGGPGASAVAVFE